MLMASQLPSAGVATRGQRSIHYGVCPIETGRLADNSPISAGQNRQAYRLRELRTVGTIQFTDNNLTITLDAEPSWYVLASNFVSKTTGQHTAYILYEPFEVTAAQ